MRTDQIRLPKGFRFEIRRELGCSCLSCRGIITYVVKLLNGKTEAGTVKLRRARFTSKVKSFETHSYLADEYRGKKLGALMYAKAVQWCLRRGYRVSSSTSPSAFAQRVWNGKTIRKYCRIIKRPSGLGTTQYHCYAKLARP